MSWRTLFERAAAYEVTVAEVRKRDGADRREGPSNERTASGASREQAEADRRDDR